MGSRSFCSVMQTILTQPTTNRPTQRLTANSASGKIVEVDTPYTDTEARQILSDATDRNDFENSLLQAQRLSPSQRIWIHKRAVERTAPSKAPEGVALSGSYARIYQMFQLAGAVLKWPKIHLVNDELTVGISLHVFGPSSRYRGQICVKDGEIYMGRVDSAGVYHQKEDSDLCLDLLQRFAQNPEAVAGKCGQLTGRCCFCSRSLSDERSTEVGYGPVCAQRFGLKWG